MPSVGILYRRYTSGMPIVLTGDEFGIETASILLCAGKQVVVPTETVYGLAANALDFDAVAQIFRIKGRPSTNPLIVHVHSLEQASSMAFVNKNAKNLADVFWPGPLTIVLNSRDIVPKNVTAGGKTVGVRMPNHLLTLSLLRHCNRPLAAPSANRSEGISPTTVGHVTQSLGENSPPILDGGDCTVGIESTVIDVSQQVVRILRPGAITRAQIESVLGQTVEVGHDFAIYRSPGQTRRHYAPSTPSVLTATSHLATPQGANFGLIYYSDISLDNSSYAKSIRLPSDPSGYAARLYVALHELDLAGLEKVIIEAPPTTEEWVAVNDRLTRAVAPTLAR
jgi:L-threonylcarbamoyladenylate synthase